ncbi:MULTISPECIES: GNAT family protein [Methylocystis]|uniref:GNAT family N-acetyltransferase n=1 Tax=Methylocystis rosea TaxID=173366 RepID=A0ABX6EEK7_9HYPH|nr:MULTISPECIES: GNAT family protein [Methylocystis]PWB91745.1 N-acetyltransferase [Methylocystis sp. MitZ-2018]QGM93253.1 GNAT family N-acetyltransferase [Methylocystis rosea]ULO24704.1 GNAT family N-acetyltransferase [Methylocystis sp. SB2]
MAIFSVIGRRDLPIRGDGLYLRASEMRDYLEWAELREKSRSFLTPWEPLWPIDDLTRASFRYRVRRHAEEMARDEAYSFFIFREEDDALMGGLSFGHVRRGVSQAATLGYWMGEPYAGKGHMTRAARAACAYAFEKRGFHRIEAACLPTNEPSKRLLERVGFKQEGYARSYLNINGQWRDHLLYAMLETDPQPINPPSPA